MHPFTSTLFSLLLPLLFFVHAPTSFSTNEAALFPNCTQTFSCGSLTNISYPFTGGPRPTYCGLPGFNLSCLNDSTTLLTSYSLSYRLIELDQTTQTLTLSRADLYDTACTQEIANTTLNATFFNISSPRNEILTLFYGCNDSIFSAYNHTRPPNFFTCDVEGSSSSDAYLLIGPVPNDPVLNFFHCRTGVTVPFDKNWADELGANRSLLGEVLRDGFYASYIDPYKDECGKCRGVSGGICGFDAEFGNPICICQDRLCPGGGKNQTLRVVGFSIAGAALLVIAAACWFLVLIQRRKNKTAQAVQEKSKDLSGPASSSKSLPTPSTNASESIPSYPSSKSDLEKGSTYFGVRVFSYTELEEATDNFDASKELGDGGFGTVYYGVLRDGRAVAVKRLYENNIKRAEQFMNEIEILTRLRHKNLVTLYGCTSRRSRELLLVYEYIPNGTVADHIHGGLSNSKLLPWHTRLSIAIETADALAYLHASDVIHRDVKTNNILLDKDFCVKVADFGLSRLFPNDVTHVSTAPQGTLGYVDPEYYQCYQLTDKSDVYSFGVVLIELISSLQAVDTSRHRQDINLANMAISKIQNHALGDLVDPCLGFEKDYSIRRMVTSVAELAFRCLQQERDMRPTMEEALEVLKTIENEHYGSKKAEVLDIGEDDVGLLKQIPPQFSPDYHVADKLDLKVKMVRTF